MAGKNCVRINALCLTARVDLAKHVRTTAVVTATSATSRRRRIRKRRVVHSQKHGARVLFVLNARKLRGQVIELGVGTFAHLPFSLEITPGSSRALLNK